MKNNLYDILVSLIALFIVIFNYYYYNNQYNKLKKEYDLLNKYKKHADEFVSYYSTCISFMVSMLKINKKFIIPISMYNNIDMEDVNKILIHTNGENYIIEYKGDN